MYCISLVIYVYISQCAISIVLAEEWSKLTPDCYICSHTKMCEVDCANIKKEPVSYVHVYVFMLQILL